MADSHSQKSISDPMSHLPKLAGGPKPIAIKFRSTNLGASNAQAVQASFLAEEIANSSHRQMKEEEGRRNAAVDAFHVAEKSIQELKKKLQEEEKKRKYATAALENAEKQAESQRLLLCTAEDNLASSKTQIATLKNKLEEVEKARGVAKTEDALRAEVPAFCKTCCAQTWEKALNQTGVEASSMFRRAESVYYPPAIRLVSSSDSKADPVPSEAAEALRSPPRAHPAANTSSEGGEQAEDTTRARDANKSTVQGADLAPTVPGDSLKEKETSQSMELVLATLAIPSKVDPKDKAQRPKL
ncbi:uncharacterized protein LOC115950345 [Quercus lobata]|uniref:uncharacterized protein LOC115950345 n=1 Tax=Quercus lobata TaxID=97700 RepID=UPI001246FA8F|nr:uncharacterized protein LOC115950345 [Quercus lobata]